MTVAIVGGGLGALRTAESLIAAGYEGRVLVISDENHLPYNRPPLSKEALKGGIDAATLEFKRKPIVDNVDWILGDAVIRTDFADKSLTLASGRQIAFDGLVIATGIRPRQLAVPGPLAGRHTLRTIEDAQSLRASLVGASSVLVIGAGFIGCEVAATARSIGSEVQVVAIDAQPMIAAIGFDLGNEMRRRHEERGVKFHLGVGIAAFLGESEANGVRLSDGSEIFGEVIVEAIGCTPNVEWLDGTGLDLSNGVLVDPSMRVIDCEVPAVAVGDIARYPHELIDSAPRRIEHWNLPTETGRRAGRTLAALLAGETPAIEPITFLPSFWSDQYEYNIQSFGIPSISDHQRLALGNWDGPLVVEYLRGGTLVGVVGIDSVPQLVPYRKQLLNKA